MSKHLLASIFVLAAVACAEPEAQTLHIQLTTRPSCGMSARTYDTTCIKALHVELRGKDERLVASQCTAVTDIYERILSMVADPSPLPVLSNVRARRNVRVVLRAYHTVAGSGAEQPCVELSEQHLMMWGSSELVDLGAGTGNISVHVECRPGCDCEDLDLKPEACPNALVKGVCGPGVEAYCRRSCESTANCYQASLSCASGTCMPERPGESCAICSASADCAAGYRCVRNAQLDETFCAKVCPPDDTSTACLPRMSCRLIGDGTAGTYEALD